MNFRIADTFTDSLARLTRDARRAAKTTDKIAPPNARAEMTGLRSAAP